MFLVLQTIVLYPRPNMLTCTLRIWLREIGFALSYGALMLKTWRWVIIIYTLIKKKIKFS
jgi:G protein-coupled receptor 158